MRSRVIIGAALLTAVAAADERNPEQIDALLNTVASAGPYRFLEYRVCSPEHCWSDSYLQWLSWETDKRVIVATVPVKELGYGVGVRSATWVSREAEHRLEVLADFSHEASNPFMVVVKPGETGRYEAESKPEMAR